MIEIENLTKFYGKFKALDNINLEFNEKRFAILGPNGAGKTTLLLILTTLLKPSKGSARINSYDILKDERKIKEIIGIVFQETSIDERLSVYENLETIAVLQKIPKNEIRKRIKEKLEALGIAEFADKKAGKLSGGIKRRVEIARALLHEPEYLFLDEPTLALDPNAREKIWEHISSLESVKIILATNYLDEAEKLCDAVAFINNGRVIKKADIKELKSRFRENIVEIETKFPEKLMRKIEKFATGRAEMSGNKIKCEIELENMKEFFENISKEDSVDSVEIRKPTLEEIFKKLFSS